jgi:hypothetical protein
MGKRGTDRSTINVHLPPDVMAAFEQYRENNCPDSSTSALARELLIIALSKSYEIGTLDATRRMEAMRTKAWMYDRIGPFLRELVQTVEVAAGELHQELARAEGQTQQTR